MTGFIAKEVVVSTISQIYGGEEAEESDEATTFGRDLGAIKAEFGWHWAGVSASYQLLLAWLVAVLVFQGGRFLGWG